jgi:hypothetical protein
VRHLGLSRTLFPDCADCDIVSIHRSRHRLHSEELLREFRSGKRYHDSTRGGARLCLIPAPAAVKTHPHQRKRPPLQAALCFRIVPTATSCRSIGPGTAYTVKNCCVSSAAGSPAPAAVKTHPHQRKRPPLQAARSLGRKRPRRATHNRAPPRVESHFVSGLCRLRHRVDPSVPAPPTQA